MRHSDWGKPVKQSVLIPVEQIEKAIHFIRGERVMLDWDLAAMYDVTTKAFNQAVRRHDERFPADFMFQLTKEEAILIRSRSQSVTLKRGSNIKYVPYVHPTRRLDELQDGAVRA